MGKTTLAGKLCHHYRLHQIKLKEVLEEKIAQLVSGSRTAHTYQTVDFPLTAVLQLQKNVLPSCGSLSVKAVDVLMQVYFETCYVVPVTFKNKENLLCFFCMLQKEIVNGPNPENISQEIMTAAQTQLGNIHKSMKENQGW